MPGVRSAKIIRTPRGPGSTDVIIASVTGLPTPDLLDAVNENLHGHELLGFDVQVKAPTQVSVNVKIEFTGDADSADVALVVEQYVHDLGIGGRFALAALYVLFEPLNLTTVEIISPARDVPAPEDGIIIASIEANKGVLR